MYEELQTHGGVPIYSWTRGVGFEEGAKSQLRDLAKLPIVGPHIAVMPDVHQGIGSTVGSVVATRGSVIPSCVGVDIGCGMCAVPTNLTEKDIKSVGAENLFKAISLGVPHGGEKGKETGNWDRLPTSSRDEWEELKRGYENIIEAFPECSHRTVEAQLGTLGSGNHFIELSIDENSRVWFVLHSGSRGVGNRIGSYFSRLAQKTCAANRVELPNPFLAYFLEGTDDFVGYMKAVDWAQMYAKANRRVMVDQLTRAVNKCLRVRIDDDGTIDCHHNYVSRETHFGEELYITRKGAVRAGVGELGIIPGSMGARSFLTRGLGNETSFCSSSHGAGRTMSRTVAKSSITLEQHRDATAGIACKKDKSIIDESPGAYKDIDVVMAAQSDLVEVVHTLRQVVCVKG